MSAPKAECPICNVPLTRSRVGAYCPACRVVLDRIAQRTATEKHLPVPLLYAEEHEARIQAHAARVAAELPELQRQRGNARGIGGGRRKRLDGSA